MILKISIILSIIFTNLFTYNYTKNKYELQISEANNKQLIRKIDNSTAELKTAKVVSKKLADTNIVYNEEKKQLNEETTKLSNTCELSSDGLRLLQDAINRSNSTSNFN